MLDFVNTERRWKVLSCPICRGTETHKMDCQNATYVGRLQAELERQKNAIGFFLQRQEDKLGYWEHRREKAEILARAALKEVESE